MEQIKSADPLEVIGDDFRALVLQWREQVRDPDVRDRVTLLHDRLNVKRPPLFVSFLHLVLNDPNERTGVYAEAR